MDLYAETTIFSVLFSIHFPIIIDIQLLCELSWCFRRIVCHNSSNIFL